ncbi:ComEA family DNA-binding protein [Hymenobacter sp. DG25B]|uniref:ComEA family DNA-binding protein n=1 Tax=Hymenobacter sp. DG25B TaxID=1385664 RepID=UPI00066297C1|nr:helix-hairpin-helix domain-containing protein [Hymenobacter sp. DG25B]
MTNKRPSGALKRAIRRYFGFSRAETNGFLFLLALMALWLALPYLLQPALSEYDATADQQELNQVAAKLAANREPRFRKTWPQRPRYARPSVAHVALVPFNPNTLTAPDWEARGVPGFVATRLVRYREAVGGFKAKSQIQKAYGLEPAVYARLAPYIQLPDQEPPRTKTAWPSRPDYPAWKDKPGSANGGLPAATRYARKPRNLAPFDLNAADTTQLQQIRGVGRRLAARVVAYRERLGGFVREEQLAEIFNLAPDLVDSLRKYTFVKEGYTPASLNINQADLAALRDHPYVGLRLGRVLIAYREQHGPFRQADDLRPIRVLDAATLEKLRPYLRF